MVTENNIPLSIRFARYISPHKPVQIRIITVQNKRYLQACLSDQNKIRILKSFGSDTPANRIQAIIFSTNYNTIDALIQEYANPEDQSKVLTVACCGAGNILGIKAVSTLEARYAIKFGVYPAANDVLLLPSAYAGIPKTQMPKPNARRLCACGRVLSKYQKICKKCWKQKKESRSPPKE